MKLTTALQKIIRAHGDSTYAVVETATGIGYGRRLDLEYAIQQRLEYERICVYESAVPADRSYRLSLPIYTPCGNVVYNIYRNCELDYTVSVYPKLTYDNYDWREFFDSTKYSTRTEVPWWKKKELN